VANHNKQVLTYWSKWNSYCRWHCSFLKIHPKTFVWH